MNNSRRSFMKKAGLGFLYLATACTKADIYVGEVDFDDEELSSNPLNDFSYSKSWEEIYTQEVYDHYNAQFKNADDYANKVYIDPTYQGGGSDGTFETPFLSLLDVSSAPNTAYLVKRGTTHSIDVSASGAKYYRMLTSDNVMLGAYGTGDRPIITDDTLECIGDYTMIRDIQIPTIRLGKYGSPYSDDSVIFNCVLDGTSETVIWGRNCKVIGCEIKNSKSNGLFVQQGDLSQNSDLEIAYCYIHKVNQAWFGDGTKEGRLNQSKAWGDPIHIAGEFRGHFWIHNNILDRSDTGNKFCFIINVAHAVPVSGIFENNACHGPMSHPSTGNILYIDGTPEMPFDKIIVRNNILLGTFDDYSDTWTNDAVHIKHAKVEVYGNLIKDVKMAMSRFNNDGGDSYFYNNTVVNVKGNDVLSAVLAGVHNNIFPHNRMNISGSHTRGNNMYLNDPSTLPENVFIDPSSDNYGLKETSLARDAGKWEDYMNKEWIKDIAGNNVPHNDSIKTGFLQ